MMKKNRCHHDQVQVAVFLLVSLIIANINIVSVRCNYEGDVLYAWKRQVVDPYNVLQSWDPTLINPCTWFHITCNSFNSVTRLDLGNAGLSGSLIPQLGTLSNLQYLELYHNNISGFIPKEIGNLKNLVSLDLYQNQLGGSIPKTLANLKSLKYMRLNSNQLTGRIPAKLFSLIFWGNLRIMDVSDNQLEGTVHHANATVTTIIQDPKA